MTEISQTPLRAPHKLIERMKVIAGWHGRSLNEELRLAAVLHSHQALLALVHDPAACSDPQLKAKLEADPDFEAKVRANLEAATVRAFGRPVPGDLLDLDLLDGVDA